MRNLFKDKKLNKVFLIILIGAILLALLDLAFMNSKLFGSSATYTLGQFPTQVWYLYESIALGMILSFMFIYWLLRKDKSETLAIGVGIASLWYLFGVEDLLYFWFQKISVPAALPWLNNNLLLPKIASALGYSSVTNISLYVSVILGLVINYFIIKWLVKKF